MSPQKTITKRLPCPTTKVGIWQKHLGFVPHKAQESGVQIPTHEGQIQTFFIFLCYMYKRATARCAVNMHVLSSYTTRKCLNLPRLR